MNKRTLRILEYNKIIDRLTGFATCPEGKRMCSRLKPMTDFEEIRQAQAETAAALSRIYSKGGLSFGGVYPVGEALKRLSVEATLSVRELLDVAGVLRATENAVKYESSDNDNEDKDAISHYFDALTPCPLLLSEIERCIISEDEIADDASRTLKGIRKDMKIANAGIHDAMTKIVSRKENETMLQDSVVVMRNGRYCIPVKSEYKNKFPGMVHDRSTTGSTCFIEPIEVVNLNNEIKELELMEKEEIENILKDLSIRVRNYSDNIKDNAYTIVKLDFIFAKARYAKDYDGTEPEFNNAGIIDIKKGRHPLLDRKKVVPIDIRLGEDFNMLIITGPNTGGKTVSLKTMGLFTLMGQSGLHIPAFQNSKLSVFEDVFADIGDEQSIEQNLSTFSSHMSNIIYILNHAKEGCLVLFDELGGGTDPVEGSALAIAILKSLNEKGIRTMATTHYSELKTFAMTEEGIENASCEFDIETLSPTYHLNIGIPGKSNAFAIAKKLGMNEDIIELAGSEIDSDTIDMESLLADLENSKRIIEEDRAKMEEDKKEISSLKEILSSKNERIEQRRKDVLRNANEQAKEIIEQAKAFADETIRKYNNLGREKGDNANKEMEKLRDEIRGKMGEVDGRLNTGGKVRKSKSKESDFHLGDEVFVISMNTSGIVRSLPKDGKMTVQMGILQSTLDISDVELVKEAPKTSKKTKAYSYKPGMAKSMAIKPEINLLGYTVDEAIAELDKYLDDACLSHLDKVRIVHGKGTGALRNGIHRYLKGTPCVKSFKLAEFGEGDAGVTIVELK